MFKIKICGVTSVADALAAIDAGADAIGLNFYQLSKRCIAFDEARRLVDVARARATVVGVFVNESADRIHEICEDTGLSVVQLHGDEPPEFLRLLNRDLEIVRTRRLDDRGLPAIVADLQACRAATGISPDALLIDAAAPGQYGGSGHTVDWRQLEVGAAALGTVPLILAGGLTPDNIAEAIRVVRPHAVDVASGVESSPGKKDAKKVRDFIAAARAAFAEF
jgi:phosphoribosylanthranilate isomerase